MKYDLHIHSSISDGKLSKNEIVQIAKKKNLEIISITDHNVFEEYKCDIPIIKGIEFDTEEICSFHTLLYFYEYTQEIKNLIDIYQEKVNLTSLNLIKKIKDVHKIEIPLDYFRYPITKRNVIDYLLENFYACSVEDANLRYTGKKSFSYVKKFSLKFTDLTSLDKDNVTVVLAHPSKLAFNDYELESFIKYLKTLKLDGIEVANLKKISREQTLRYLKIAKDNLLLTSSGSDFHDVNKDIMGMDNNYSNELIKKYLK